MSFIGSKIGRSLFRAGPLGIAIVLGIFLVAISALSYRDARNAAGIVFEREGIRLFQRIGMTLGRRLPESATAESLSAVLEANQTLGLTYIAFYYEESAGHSRSLIAEAGKALLPRQTAALGPPAVGNGRVRMTFGPPSHPLFDGPPMGVLLPGGLSPPSGMPPLPPLPPFRIEIEFEPIASMEAVHRAFAVLLLSIGASLSLTAAALILAARAARAERTKAEMLAQRHLAQLGTLSAVLAHEIRNPLASLKGHAQLLAERVDDPQLSPRIGQVVAEAVRLERLTNDLLEFARSGAIRLALASPRAVVERAVREIDPTRIDTDVGDAPADWSLDADRIHQVLTNLLENAVAVTAPPDRVTIAAAREGDGVVFSVRDHGPGVPAAERAQVFEPFHTTKTRGTGLGLAVAKRIVEIHGGSIEVRDAPEGGALFRVYLPSKTSGAGE